MKYLNSQVYVVFTFYIIFLLSVSKKSMSMPDNHLKTYSFFERNIKEECKFILNNCFCETDRLFLFNQASVVCKNMTDFSKLERFAQSFDKISKLTFTDMKYLPARSLQGLLVDHLVLDDPDLTVDENVFEGMIALGNFDVKRSSIQDIPDFGISRNSIYKISIQSSRLTSLEGKNLQNLTKVYFLYFRNNSIRFLDPDVFKGIGEGVKILDLSYNNLTYLPPKLLDPMKYLYHFYISHNNLHHVDNVFSTTHPRYIRLDFNNITDVDSVLHFNMEKVLDFNIGGNPIKKVSENSFTGKIPNVQQLFLDHCELRDFSIEHFRSLSKLRKLDLSHNSIEDVSEPEEISTIKAETQKYALMSLNLSENKLRSLNPTLELMSAVRLQIDRNEIQYLTDEDFSYANSTAHLELQKNEIRRIDNSTFKFMRKSLSYLDLSSNLITSLNGSVKYLSQLIFLNLSHNLIQVFSKDDFIGLNELSGLYLHSNKIKILGWLQQLLHLQYLVITHNSMEYIPPDRIPENLKSISIAGNPLKCNCRIQPFLHRVETENLEIDIDLCLNTHPVNNSMSACPSMCSCGCTNYKKTYFITVDCSSKNLSVVPELLGNDFIQIEYNTTIPSLYGRPLEMHLKTDSSFYIKDPVLGINLENNILESLESAHLPPNLVQLLLSNNKLRRLPDSIFDHLKNLKQVSISRNPWVCDCSALKFKKWLIFNKEIIQDINETRCGVSEKGETDLSGKLIWTLSDPELCPSYLELIVSVSISVLILIIFALVTIVLYTKYKLNIKVFLYSHGLTFVKEKDLDDDKMFDAFISYSDLDGEFVTKQIVEVIENKNPNIRLCIHDRHFLPGRFIQDNIIEAVENSKRTVVILSRSFLESQWCLFEFRTAHEQGIKDKMNRIIIIRVGDLPKELDPLIKVHLKTRTYMTWDEKNFWNKLLFVLPSSRSDRNVLPENVEETKNF